MRSLTCLPPITSINETVRPVRPISNQKFGWWFSGNGSKRKFNDISELDGGSSIVRVHRDGEDWVDISTLKGKPRVLALVGPHYLMLDIQHPSCPLWTDKGAVISLGKVSGVWVQEEYMLGDRGYLRVSLTFLFDAKRKDSLLESSESFESVWVGRAWLASLMRLWE